MSAHTTAEPALPLLSNPRPAEPVTAARARVGGGDPGAADLVADSGFGLMAELLDVDEASEPEPFTGRVGVRIDLRTPGTR
ncbi:hypothetical protein Kisp02_04590 [Kineosporia sp. NBRC 101731]|nr:hypothetical protein Kisp02_04590 [Kineosporia sp. NBRC 101731]